MVSPPNSADSTTHPHHNVMRQHQQQQQIDNNDLDYDFGCDRWPLHYACRVGHLAHVQYLVDVLKKPVNEANAHDATPLYLAALTGQNDICRFLLERGAKCDVNDGDAARVFYVALTPELRQLLRQWSLTAASRDPFLDSLRKSFNDPTHADCVVQVLGVDGGRGEKSSRSSSCFFVHTVMLQQRCPLLAAKIEFPLTTNNDDDDASLLGIVALEAHPCAVAVLLEYLYTGFIHLQDARVAEALHTLARTLELVKVAASVASALHEYLENLARRFRWDYSDPSLLKQDMRTMAQLVSKSVTMTSKGVNDNVTSSIPSSNNVMIQCQDCLWSLHRFRLCAQSDYLERALSGGFREANESFVDLSHLVSNPEAVRLTIQWMYAEAFITSPSIEDALDVLDLSFAILCPRLSNFVANAVLVQSVDRDTVVDFFSLAHLHGFERLENQCVQWMGQHLVELAHDAQFHMLLTDEGKGIAQGGDVGVMDVPMAAEIRRVIQHNVPRESRREYMELLQKLVEDAIRAVN